jgi:hypothetical protein
VLTSRISSHLRGALRNISRYSSSAADDIITAIRELCETDCTEVIFTSPHTSPHSTDAHIEHTGADRGVDLLSALLHGYSSHPKKPSGRVTNEVPWKVAVSTALTDMFRLINKKPITEGSNDVSADHNSSVDLGCNNVESEGFSEDLVYLVIEQLVLLYNATGVQTSLTGSELLACCDYVVAAV